MPTDQPDSASTDAVPTVETESGERQLDPDADRPAEKAIGAAEVLEDAAHQHREPDDAGG